MHKGGQRLQKNQRRNVNLLKQEKAAKGGIQVAG
jgi:hypothetical protein